MIKKILEPIKDAHGCGINIRKRNGQYVWGYFGWYQKIPSGMQMKFYKLEEEDFSKIRTAAESAATEFGFKIFDVKTKDGAPALKLYLE